MNAMITQIWKEEKKQLKSDWIEGGNLINLIV